MENEEFWTWLESCPTNKWDTVSDDVDKITIVFPIDIDKEE